MSSEAPESNPAEPTAPQEAVPTCFRHPGREAHIRCTRCARPICPECMIPASVGFQCPDDVRAGAATVRQPRTAFGASVSSDTPWVTRTLIAACVVMYALQQAVPGFTDRLLETSAVPQFSGIAAGEWYRLMTATFLHGGIMHLALNMYALYLFGPQLEAVLGRARFLGLYLVSGLGGAAASYTFASPGSASLGASGAIFGLFAAFIVVARRLGRDVGQLWVLLAINLAIGFLPGLGIDWHAHAGGFVTGGLLGLALAYTPRPRALAAFVAAAVLLLAASVAAVSWRTGDAHQTSAVRALSCEVQHPAGGEGYLGCVEGQ